MTATNDQQLGITITVTEEETGYELSIVLPAYQFFYVYRLINDESLTPIDAYMLAQFGAWIANGGPIPKEQYSRIEAAIRGMEKRKLFPDEVWESTEDALLSFSYHLLRARIATYAQLAEVASKALNRPVKTDAWKQRVRRWAERRNLPKVGQRKRRSVSDKPGSIVTSDTVQNTY